MSVIVRFTALDATHRHLAHWVAGVGRKRGHEVHIEWTVPGTSHPVDVAWNVAGEWHAFEICVSCTDNIVSHLGACLVESLVVASVTVIAGQASSLEPLRAVVDAESTLTDVRHRVRFEVIGGYLVELFGV